MSDAINLVLIRQNATGSQHVGCSLPDALSNTRPTALEALKHVQATQLPDLAWRYGCRNGLCGVCTIDINGRPKLACRAKVRNGDRLSALNTLPAVKDFVVKRDHINRAVRRQIPVEMKNDESKHHDSPELQDLQPLHKLNKCIECYACLSGCTLHAKNKTPGEIKYGNPYLFLKIQKVMVDPMSAENSKQQALKTAVKLGIERYDINNAPHCGVGINLKTEVIQPLQLAVSESNKVNLAQSDMES